MPPPAKPASPPWLGSLLACVGVVLVVVGIAWPLLLPTKAVWSEEQAQELSKAQEAAHEASIGHRHGPQAEQALDPQQAREHYHQLSQKLKRARNFQQRGGRYLALTGLVVALGGLWLLRRHRQA